MSKPDECERCAEGDTSRITDTVICLCCKQQKPIKEMVMGFCKDCLTKYRICGMLKKRYHCSCVFTSEFCGTINDIIKEVR